MNKKKKLIIMAAVLCAAALFSLGISKGMWVQALFDEEDAVHIDASEVEEGTLIIGTHMIHISAVGDEIYEIADASSSESGQMKKYYKSELADGAWFDITDAASLKDITTEGMPVEDSVIEELFLTHHTKSDGITYDLKTGAAVSMFDISDPYSLESLSELEPLKLQYDILTDKDDKTETDEACEERIKKFFKTKTETEETKRLDRQLKALQEAYASAKDEKQSAIVQTMEAVDASRRIVVLEKIKDPLNELVEFLTGQGGEANADLNSGAGDSVGNVEESLLEYGAKELSEGSTVLSKEEYTVKKALIAAAEEGNKEAVNTAAEKAGLLTNIIEDVIGNAKKELDYLNNTLLPAAKDVYSSLITGGTGEDYKAAAAGSNASKGVLNKALKDRLNEAETAKSELQFLINAAIERMSAEKTADFLKGLKDEAEAMKNEVKDDAFASYANSSIEAFVEYLNNLLANNNPTENEGSLSELLKQKEKKQEEKLSALDANDLEGAKKAEAELDTLNEKIDVLEKKMSESGEAVGETEEGTTPKTALQSAKKLAKSAVETIQDGNVSGVSEAIDGLGALMSANPDAALDGLQDIYKALTSAAYLAGAEEEGSKTAKQDEKKTSEFETCMVQVEEVLAENASALNKTSLSDEAAKEILEEVAGKAIEEQSEEEQAALLEASLAALEQQANEGIKKMAQILAAQMEANGSPYIFRQYNDPASEYIPAETISECMGYRYVYDNNQQKVTLSGKGKYFTFRAFQKEYEQGKDKKELSKNAGFQGDVYLFEQDTEELFKCTAQYVPGSSLALLVTQDNSEQSSAYLSMLLTRLGG